METLLEWIATHPHWAGLAVFLVAFTESLAIVGLFMPGAFLMFGIGALIALDHLAFLPIMAWAVVGAILGDGLSFWIGRHFQQELRAIWPFRNYPRLVNRGVDFFHHHGGKSILFGRFIGPVRPIMPAVAGMLGMPIGRYVTINILSGIAWAPAYLLPGMLFGASLELAAAVAGRLALLLLLLAGLFWFIFSLARGLWRLAAPRAHMAVLRLLDWGHHHPRFAALTTAIGDPGGPEVRGLAVLAFVLLAGAVLLFGVVHAIFPVSGSLDQTLHGLLLGLRTPQADLLLIAVTELGDGLFLILYVTLVALGLGWYDRTAARHWLAAAAFAALAPALLKGLFQLPRPEPFDLLLGSTSFPSAHALRATVIYGFATVLLVRAVPMAARWLPYGVTALLITAIAFSRPYLGVHWPSDVLAGMLLGTLWVVLLGTAYRVRATAPAAPARLTTVLLLPLVVVAVIYIPLRLESDVAHYNPTRAPTTLGMDRWQLNPWPELAIHTPEASAIGGAPVLAWAAPLDCITVTLDRAGWQPAQRDGLMRWLRTLNPTAPLVELPPLPQVRDGREAVGLRVQVDKEGSRLVLRLWDSGLRLDGVEGIPIWIGRLTRERQAVLLGLMAYARGEPAESTDLASLAATLPANWPREIESDWLRIDPAMPEVPVGTHSTASRSPREDAPVPLTGSPCL